MLAQGGWKTNPSPRRGFTLIEASRTVPGSPVVAAVHEPAQGFRLFRAAVDEAMSRSLDLVVLEFGAESLRDSLQTGSGEIDDRERNTLRALLANPHVRLIRFEPVESDLERTVSFCESVGASMLVVGAEHISATPIDPALANRIFNGEFDVLVVTDHPAVDRPQVEPEHEGQ